MAVIGAVHELGAQRSQVARMTTGLVISVVSDDGSRSLDYTATYRAGSRNEPAGLGGVAHLTEHVAMREVKGGATIAATVARLGVRAGASTADSVTAFWYEAEPMETILDSIFAVEKVRMTALAILPAAVDAERKRIVAEGSRHRDLDRITADDVLRFHSEFYQPARCSIAVRSPLPTATVLRLAEARFGPIATRSQVVSTGASATGSPATAWARPDTTGLRWHSVGESLRWVATTGGDRDSVYFAALIAVPPEQASAKDIAALELFARTFRDVRLRNGRFATDSLATLGGTVDVVSVPYPPLATADRFRELAAPLTPLGGWGIRVEGAIPRRSWANGLTLIAEAIATGQASDSAVALEIEKQRKLLEEAQPSAMLQAEVTFRRNLPALPFSAEGAWRPAPLDSQLALMRSMTPRDVEGVRAVLVRNGIARVALLGVDAATAEGPITNSALARLRGAPAIGAAPVCSQPVTRQVATANARSEVFFAICIPSTGDERSIAALQLVNAILGGREDAVLAQRLRQETGLVYAFESRVLPSTDAHAVHWHLRVGTRTESAAQVIGEVRQMLERLSIGGVSPQQLEDFREWLVAQRLRRAIRGPQWAQSAALFGAWPELEATRIAEVTLEDVNLALTHWRPDRLAITAPVAAGR